MQAILSFATYLYSLMRAILSFATYLYSSSLVFRY